MDAKKEIRKTIESLRNQLSKEEKQDMDLSIYNKVITHQEYINAKYIFIYVSYKNEVYTHAIIKHALSCGKIVAVPVILQNERKIIAIRIYDFSKLKENKYGILEPELEQNNIIDGSKFDLIFIPGTAFDKNYGRVGYGGGMYDKYFSNKSIEGYKLALAYGFQIFDKVPMEDYDLRVDEIITD